jgi:predicted nucleotidyltransferase
MSDILDLHRDALGELCREYGVRQLDVFGSASRRIDFGEASDIDLLADYEAGRAPPSLGEFLALRQRLSDLLGRPVDLVMSTAIRNPYVRASIERTRRRLHGA